MDVHLQKREQEFTFPLPFFIPFGPSKDWMMPAHFCEGGSSLLNLLIQMLISSGNTHIVSRPEIMFYQLSGHPLGQSR